MSPITNKSPNWRSEAKVTGGWTQVRESLQSFEGTVSSIVEGKWNGNEKEFEEINCIDNVPLALDGNLSMDITKEFNFRINTSEAPNSFWIADFLEACDRLKIIFPEGLVGKRVRWKKVKREAKNPQYSTANYVPEAILDSQPTTQESPAESSDPDPLASLAELAIGKTEKQFRVAAGLDQRFTGSPLLALVRTGDITKMLLTTGKLSLDGEIYRKV